MEIVTKYKLCVVLDLVHVTIVLGGSVTHEINRHCRPIYFLFTIQHPKKEVEKACYF